MKYVCCLINEDGCNFDSCGFDSKKSAHNWASGRGTSVKYTAVLLQDGQEVANWTPRG